MLDSPKLKIPVVWFRDSGPGSRYSKVDSAQFFIIGEEGETVLLVTKGAQLFVPIFELASIDEAKIDEKILERMVAVAECQLKTGVVGNVYGVFRRSYQIFGGQTMYVKEVGLACTASEFNPSEILDEAECVNLGLPTSIEVIDTRVL